jgi:hypothetical protein
MEILAGRFKLVHRGGHHVVYCNLVEHVRLSGDHVGTAPLSQDDALMRIESFKCDCHDYMTHFQPLP